MARTGKILLVTTHFRPLVGGALEVYDQLGRALHGEMAVLTARADYLNGNAAVDCAAFDAAAPYPIHRVRTMTPAVGDNPDQLQQVRRGLSIYRRTRKLIAKYKTRTVIIAPPHRLGWLVPLLKTTTRAKIVVYAHGEEINSHLMHSTGRQLPAALRDADHIVAVSRFTAARLINALKIPKERVTVIPNAVNQKRWDGLPAPSIEVNDYAGPRVFSFGRLVERKGFLDLISAWPMVVEVVKDAELVIAGGGPLEGAIKAAIKASPAQKSITFYGPLADQDIAALLDAATLFAMPNKTMADGDTEGFGLVFLEAGLKGLPSVGGRAGGAPDAISDGETGLLVDAGEPRDIARAISGLLVNGKRRIRMGQAALARARSATWTDRADQLRKTIAKL